MLEDVNFELDYQGRLLSRIINSISTDQAGDQCKNVAIPGLEMVLMEIRAMRSELKTQQTQINSLREAIFHKSSGVTKLVKIE
jgi:hypothetical protein